jgi:hypothetical protein
MTEKTPKQMKMKDHRDLIGPLHPWSNPPKCETKLTQRDK